MQKRHRINIGGDHYLIELIDEKSTGYVSTSKYHVFKNFTMINDIPFVSDIFFVDKDIDMSDIDVWPVSDSDFSLMSTSPSAFNKDYMSERMMSSSEENSILIDEDIYEKNVKTMTIRIWHPTTSISHDMIVYVDSCINSVHFHWYARKMSDGSIGTSSEINMNQDVYTEYVDLKIPDFKDVLYGGTYCMSSYSIKKNELSRKFSKYVELNAFGPQSIHSKYDSPIGEEIEELTPGCQQIVDIGLLLSPWKYSEDDEIEYIDDTSSCLVPVSLKVTLYPWDSVSSNDGTYLMDNYAKPSSYTFVEEMKMSIEPKIGFMDGKISAIGQLRYPREFDSASSAWQKMWKTDFSKYKSLSEVVSKDEDMMEALGNSEMVKYVCTISSDIDSKNVLHVEEAYSDKVDDFAFSLRDLFGSWSQVPSQVFVKLSLEDRAIGKGCLSPTKIITRDQLRHTILDTTSNRLMISKMSDKFNFIDHINCRIVKNDNESEISTKQTSPRMIYKPIFFRVQDLQSMTLRSNMTQNVGIMLSDYMTKVNEFVMKIGDKTFFEVGRTGAFVIFSVRTNDIEESNGKYDILTSDGDYISTGNYQIN